MVSPFNNRRHCNACGQTGRFVKKCSNRKFMRSDISFHRVIEERTFHYLWTSIKKNFTCRSNYITCALFTMYIIATNNN